MSLVMPKLVAFDLDGTIWTPDMYELWGGGAPFTIQSHDTLLDSSGSKVKLLGESAKILHELKHDFPSIITTWVSCTDEPSWAAECLLKFKTHSGEPIGDCINGPPQIFKSDKQEHFKRLKKVFPDIPYEDMVFFDNEMGNIRSVSRLSVVCMYCPDGMTRNIYNEGLALYRNKLKLRLK
jgi:magnesium-dependent phosphatase 1